MARTKAAAAVTGGETVAAANLSRIVWSWVLPAAGGRFAVDEFRTRDGGTTFFVVDADRRQDQSSSVFQTDDQLAAFGRAVMLGREAEGLDVARFDRRSGFFVFVPAASAWKADGSAWDGFTFDRTGSRVRVTVPGRA